MSERKKVSIKLKNPNPLFIKWVTEWRDKAIEKDSKMQYCFQKALDSLKKYPLPLETGRDCKILNGFGEKMCQMIDQTLIEYNSFNKGKVNETLEQGILKQNRPDKYYEYKPAYRSGAYAILLTLYKQTTDPSCEGFLLKKDIIKEGQQFCEKSFVKSENGSYYTAWSSMKTLLDKNLIRKSGSPARFSLSQDGIDLCCELFKDELSSSGSSKKVIPTKYSSKFAQSNFKNDICTGISDRNTYEGSNDNICTNIKNVIPKISKSNTEFTTTNRSQNFHSHETTIFPPHTFDIILLIDTKETTGKKANPLDDPLIIAINQYGIQYELRHLKVGDYSWICRSKDTNIELVLPYIIERKRMDDFGASIKDGRFHEQKFRLTQCGIQNLIYLVESHGDNTHTGLPLSTLHQAATNTLVQDHFSIKFTDNLRATVQYLFCLTKILSKKFCDKTLISCPKENLTATSEEDDLVPLMLFQEFNKNSAKSKDLSVKEMFVSHLIQIKGVSLEKAIAVVNKYPTPLHLKKAYVGLPEKDGEKLLSTLKFGKFHKNIGPVISTTIYQLYCMGRYPR